MVWSTMWKMLDRETCRAVQCARKLQRPNGKIIPPFSEQPLAKNITQHKPSHIHSDRAEFYTQGLNQSNSEVPASFGSTMCIPCGSEFVGKGRSK